MVDMAAPPRRTGGAPTPQVRTGDRADLRRSWPTRAVGLLLAHPEPVLRLLGDRGPVVRDGRELNRNTQAMLALIHRFGPGRDADRDPERARRRFRSSTRLAMPVRNDVGVDDRVIPGPAGSGGVPVRLYRPAEGGSARGSGLPAVVYFHGGGWVIGDLDSHDATCRLLAAASGCLVVSVAYRRAPEHPFPAAVDDCLAAYGWVHRNQGPLGIADGAVGVMGDSAGGNLAAVVALSARAGVADLPPAAAQALVYPVTDAHLATDSMRALADGFSMTRAAMVANRARYLPDPATWDDPRASPLLAGDLSGAPPALVVTAGFDPLRDDGELYATALARAGVEVDYRCYDDQIHGFLGMGILPRSWALAVEISGAVGRLMHRSDPVG
jgi:acetyl esterase